MKPCRLDIVMLLIERSFCEFPPLASLNLKFIYLKEMPLRWRGLLPGFRFQARFHPIRNPRPGVASLGGPDTMWTPREAVWRRVMLYAAER